MGMFGNLFSFGHKDGPDLLPAIERAVDFVEPQLKQTHQYPGAFRKPVRAALEYVHDMAQSVPGPVTTDLDSYAHDAFVHAIFPSMDVISDAFRTSRAMQEYLHAHPASREIYALMGMRRREKTMMGMKLAGEVIQRDVPQHMIYFASHTIESPAPSEALAREHAAWSFFDNLVKKVAQRVSARKQEMLSKQQEKDILMARLHAASPEDRPSMETELSRLLSDMQATGKSLDLHHYPDDFEEVMLHPEKHLRLNRFPMILDSMGIERSGDDVEQAEPIIFNELVGFDRRDWIVTIVHCHDVQSESFAARLEDAYRRLSI